MFKKIASSIGIFILNGSALQQRVELGPFDSKSEWHYWKDLRRNMAHSIPKVNDSRNPSTSVLSATTLIYIIGAGITAAAGTRFALQTILIKRI